jgi:hypothetical protein
MTKLSQTPEITQIPNNLKVGGNLSESHITSLPNNLEIGSIYKGAISYTNVGKMIEDATFYISCTVLVSAYAWGIWSIVSFIIGK